MKILISLSKRLRFSKRLESYLPSACREVGTFAISHSKLAKLSPRVVQRTRRAMRAAMSNDLDTQLALERDIQREVGFGNDYAEGVRAFLEKREPQFTGT